MERTKCPDDETFAWGQHRCRCPPPASVCGLRASGGQEAVEAGEWRLAAMAAAAVVATAVPAVPEVLADRLGPHQATHRARRGVRRRCAQEVPVASH